jgi:hypothetical protein
MFLKVDKISDIKHYISIYQICNECKPSFATKLLTAFNNRIKIEKEYKEIKKELVGEFGSISIDLQLR